VIKRVERARLTGERYREMSLAYQSGVPRTSVAESKEKRKRRQRKNRTLQRAGFHKPRKHKVSEWLATFAAQNIQNATKAEKILWIALEEVLPRHNLTLRFQYPCVRYILDFYIPEISLAIEVDGGIHLGKVSRDKKRTLALSKIGIRVVRFWNEEIEQDIVRVIHEIMAACGPAYAFASTDINFDADRGI
jgi:very-short-patch-repair endonuclease